MRPTGVLLPARVVVYLANRNAGRRETGLNFKIRQLELSSAPRRCKRIRRARLLMLRHGCGRPQRVAGSCNYTHAIAHERAAFTCRAGDGSRHRQLIGISFNSTSNVTDAWIKRKPDAMMDPCMVAYSMHVMLSNCSQQLGQYQHSLHGWCGWLLAGGVGC